MKITKNQLREMIKEALLKEQGQPTEFTAMSKREWLAAYSKMHQAVSEFIKFGGSYSDEFDPMTSNEIDNMDGRLQNVLKQYNMTANRVRKSLARQRQS